MFQTMASDMRGLQRLAETNVDLDVRQQINAFVDTWLEDIEKLDIASDEALDNVKTLQHEVTIRDAKIKLLEEDLWMHTNQG